MAIKILLDAGHYGNYQNPSPCATSPKYYESNMTWTLHLLLKAELGKYGFVVGTTRADKQKDLPVYDRGQMAKGYDMFISLHSNAADTCVKNGVDRPVIIYPILADKEVVDFADVLGKTVMDIMQTKQKYQLYVREYPDWKNVDYYGVIRGAVAAGCKKAYVIEHGFHTDSYCTTWLLNETNLKRLAAAEAKVIADYFGVKITTATPAPTPAPAATPTIKTLYKVQVGSYANRTNAEHMLKSLSDKGFKGFIVEEKK